MKSILYTIPALILAACVVQIIGHLLNPPTSVDARSYGVVVIICVLFIGLMVVSILKAVQHLRKPHPTG